MTAGAILWLGLLVVLAGLFVITARRLSVLIARTRDLERVQRTVAGVEQRLAATVEPLVASLDEIRRHAGDPARLARDLGPTRDVLEDLAGEMRAMRVPAGLAAQAAVMIHETERAARAADLVGHGLDALLDTRGPGEHEAQTSLKRGTLNLRHAREAFGRSAAEVAALRPADLITRSGWRGSAAVPAAPALIGDLGDVDPEASFEPRM